MSSNTEVTVSVDGPTASIVFSTADGLNVMSSEVLEKLATAVETARSATDVRWTILRAEGKVFVAGADIKQMAAFDPDQARRFSQRGNEVMDALASLPSITMAAMQGTALGGGCEIVLACDFRIATEAVKIGLPETSLGLIPGWGGTQRSLRLLGPTWARRLVWGATPLPASEAARIGLVDEVVAGPQGLDAAIERLQQQLGRGGPRAIALAKRAFLTGDEPSAFGDCLAGDESREGMTAFIEKRKAHWMEA
ncbi:MAG: enoyl-CoA hydratase/isomerase family protein [Planctomycetota bacterium]|jgi:enoyl-CoA hydratase